MRLVNLTPHRLDVHTPDGVRQIEPSGSIARVSTVETEAAPIDGIPVSLTSFGELVGLPDPEEGVVLIVSGIVSDAARRPDVVSPGPLIRGADGQPVGCRGLARRV